MAALAGEPPLHVYSLCSEGLETLAFSSGLLMWRHLSVGAGEAAGPLPVHPKSRFHGMKQVEGSAE